MKKRLLPILIISAVVLSGCGDSSSDYSMKTDSYTAAEEAADYYDNGMSYSEDSASIEYDDAVGDYGKKLIHNYSINIQTTEYDTVTEGINKKIAECGGYIESSNMNNYDNSRRLSIMIRIPQEKAEEFLDYAGTAGNVTYSSENTTDKTLEYVDIDSRMKSYKQEIEVMEGLAKRAESVSELIEIENNIADLRGRIDSFQSQLNSIDNKVSYSTIDMNVDEVERYSYVKPGFWANVGEGLKDSLDEVGDMVSGFIVGIPIFIVGFILFLIPFSLVIIVLVSLFRLCKKLSLFGKSKKKEETVAEVDLGGK